MHPAPRLILPAVFLLAFAVLSPAHAETPSFTYIAPDALPPTLLVPPPAQGSATWRREMAAVRTAQAHIPSTDLAALRNEQHMRVELMTDVIGTGFTRERFPKSFLLLDGVTMDAAFITEADKKFWHIRRPYLVDGRVKLLVDPIDKSPAYPSGHTSEARVLAEVLGLLYPDKLEALRARAADIARHRIEAGVHYPADIKAGETLAALIMGALMQSSDFQDDLTRAAQEIGQMRQPNG